jgi:hypothetical protein
MLASNSIEAFTVIRRSISWKSVCWHKVTASSNRQRFLLYVVHSVGPHSSYDNSASSCLASPSSQTSVNQLDFIQQLFRLFVLPLTLPQPAPGSWLPATRRFGFLLESDRQAFLIAGFNLGFSLLTQEEQLTFDPMEFRFPFDVRFYLPQSVIPPKAQGLFLAGSSFHRLPHLCMPICAKFQSPWLKHYQPIMQHLESFVIFPI